MPGLILTAMCLIVLMVQLDTTVVNLALHTIQRELHAPISELHRYARAHARGQRVGGRQRRGDCDWSERRRVPDSGVWLAQRVLGGRADWRTRLCAGTDVSAGIVGSGLVIFATTSADTSIPMLLGAMVIVGVALGLETGPLRAVAVAGVGPERSGHAHCPDRRDDCGRRRRADRLELHQQRSAAR